MPETYAAPKLFAALIRHGHYEQPEDVPSAHLPHPLTERGREQASQMAAALVELAAEHGWTIWPEIDTSSLLRAYETATTVARGLESLLDMRVTVHETPDLAERGLGAAANLPVSEIERIVARDPRYAPLPKGWKATSWFRLPFPGAESLLQAGARVAAHVQRRTEEAARQAGRPTLRLFFGHGGAFRHAAVHMGTLTLDEIPGLSMWHCRPVVLEHLGNGRWHHAAGAWKVRQRGEPRD